MEDKGKRRYSWFAVVMILIAVWFSYKFVQQQSSLNAVNQNYAVAKARLAKAQERNATLRVERDSLSDAAYIEKVAREDLGMTRQGEMPYISARR